MKTKFALAPISIGTIRSKIGSVILVAALVGAVAATCHGAGVELVTRDVTGYGDSEQTAVTGGLVEAVRQIRGLSIDSEKDLRTSLAENDSGQNLKVELNDQVRSRTKGLIHSYEVLNLEHQQDRWVAKLRVTLPQYRPAGTDRSSLPTIAVLPFRAKIPHGPELARSWEQKLVTQIAEAGCLQVVDREYSSDVDGETVRLRSGNTSDTELVRLGQQLGADYVVVGEITHLDLTRQRGKNLLDESSAAVEYRIIDPATREIRRANTVTLSYNQVALQQLGLQSDERQAQDYLLNASADAVVADVVDLVHPTKPGKLALEISPADYVLYVNGRRASGTANEFVLPSERELSLRLTAKGYETSERTLRLAENGRDNWKVALAPSPSLILDAATNEFKPAGSSSFNGKNYLLFGFLGLGKRVADGETVSIQYKGASYDVQVANIEPSKSYDLQYKGQSRTLQLAESASQPTAGQSAAVASQKQPQQTFTLSSFLGGEKASATSPQPARPQKASQAAVKAIPIPKPKAQVSAQKKANLRAEADK